MKRLIGKESGDIAVIVNDYLVIINGVKYHYNMIDGVIRLHRIEFYE
jgi:hypothetical protein